MAARISENHHGPRPPPGSPLEMPAGVHGSPGAQRGPPTDQMAPYLEEIKAGELFNIPPFHFPNKTEWHSRFSISRAPEVAFLMYVLESIFIAECVRLSAGPSFIVENASFV